MKGRWKMRNGIVKGVAVVTGVLTIAIASVGIVFVAGVLLKLLMVAFLRGWNAIGL